MILPPRWYGTTFTVQYSNEPSQKTPLKVHLITSRDAFDLISLDWKTSMEQFSAQEIDRIESKKTTAVLVMKPQCKFTTIFLTTAPDPCDHIAEALTLSPPPAKPEPHYLSAVSIIPSMRINQAPFIRSVVELCNQLLQFFGTQPTICPPLVDAVICFYRGRFFSDGLGDINLTAAGIEIKRLLIVIWSKSYPSCLQSGDSSNASFQQKMGQSILITLKKVATNIGIPCSDLEGVGMVAAETIVKRIGQVAQGAIDKDDTIGARALAAAALAMLGGAVVGLYEVDMRAFAQGIVEYVQVAIDRPSATEQARYVLQQKQLVFLREMLCLLDGRRFDESFQWIYCLWELRGRDSH
jgi:hypothetical protein